MILDDLRWSSMMSMMSDSVDCRWFRIHDSWEIIFQMMYIKISDLTSSLHPASNIDKRQGFGRFLLLCWWCLKTRRSQKCWSCTRISNQQPSLHRLGSSLNAETFQKRDKLENETEQFCFMRIHRVAQCPNSSHHPNIGDSLSPTDTWYQVMFNIPNSWDTYPLVI